jgi:uncharacterized membrane protein YbjE (DUF340 family)
MLFTTTIALLVGFLIGYKGKLFFKSKQKVLNRLSSWLLLGMLFFLGINLSNQNDLIQNFSSVFVLSLILAIVSSLGSIFTNKLLNKLTAKNYER